LIDTKALNGFIKDIFWYDPALFVHSLGVANIALQIAVSLEIQEQMELLTYGAILHDLGKTSIDKSVLYKQGPLNKEEKDIIKQHTVIGAQILEKEGFFKELQEIVFYHHEHWDGNGYIGLTGENIPFLVQIISLADAMDAMISNRTYRSVLSPVEVFVEIQNCCGSQFSPSLVQNLKKSQFWPIGDSCSEKVSSLMGWESQWLHYLADVFDDLHHPLLLIQSKRLDRLITMHYEPRLIGNTSKHS